MATLFLRRLARRVNGCRTDGRLTALAPIAQAE
jgi:hypothetical protein